MVDLLLRALDAGSIPAVVTSLVVAVILVLREVRRRRHRLLRAAPVPTATPTAPTVIPPAEDSDQGRPSRPSVNFRRELEARSWASADRRVLVIDDNDGLGRAMVAAIMRMRGPDGTTYAASWVGSAEEGLEAIDRDPPPDLYVVDLFLPGMSGMSFVERVRAVTTHRPPLILIISGQGDQGSLDQVARSCGADAALAKSFELLAFEQMIRLMFEAAPDR